MSLRLVALGDSSACGIGDPMPDGSWRGFAALLAAAFDDVDFVNLATSGARTQEVRQQQLQAALELRPQIACLMVGVNDSIRSDFDPAFVRDNLLTTAGALTEVGATLLTVRLHDHSRIFRLPTVFARPLLRRISAMNEVYDELFALHGGLRVDLTDYPWVYQRDSWSVDRLHPSELGHRRLAFCFARLLAEAGWPVMRLPSLETSGGAAPSTLADLRWLVGEGVPWAGRRARDLLPWAATLASKKLMASTEKRVSAKEAKELARRLAQRPFGARVDARTAHADVRMAHGSPQMAGADSSVGADR